MKWFLPKWLDRWINPQEHIPQPATLPELIDRIWKELSNEDKAFLRSGGKPDYFVGRYIRNKHGLWIRSTPVVKWSISNLGLDHADDISGLIVTSLEHKAQGKAFNLFAEAEYYKNHWRALGINPAETCLPKD